MAYAFDPHDTDLAASLRRIAGEQLDAASQRLGALRHPAAVHDLRKNLKKTRALLRLVRAGLAEQSAINQGLRAIGLAVSDRRDAEVRLATLDRLFPTLPVALGGFRDALSADIRTPPDIPADRLIDTLAAIRDALPGWRLSGNDGHILRQGLASTRRRARRAALAARHSPGAAELIHDWRKRVKDHWYQSRLFAPAWPELFKPIVASADQLGEALGDHHDLSVLAAHAAGLSEAVLPDLARRMLAARIQDSQAHIEAKAFPLGARLFAGDPGDVADLWVDWRKVWLRHAA